MANSGGYSVNDGSGLPGSHDSKKGGPAFPGSLDAISAFQKLARENLKESKKTLRRISAQVEDITALIATLKLEGHDTVAEEQLLVQLTFAAEAAAKAVDAAEDVCASVDLNPDEDDSEVLLIIDGIEGEHVARTDTTLPSQGGAVIATSTIMTKSVTYEEKLFAQQYQRMRDIATEEQARIRATDFAQRQNLERVQAEENIRERRLVQAMAAAIKLGPFKIPGEAPRELMIYVKSLRSAIIAGGRSFLFLKPTAQIQALVDSIVVRYSGNISDLGNLAELPRIAAQFTLTMDPATLSPVVAAAQQIAAVENETVFAAIESQTNIPDEVQVIIRSVKQLSGTVELIARLLECLAIFDNRALSKDELLAREDSMQHRDISLAAGAVLGFEQWNSETKILLSLLAEANIPSSLSLRKVPLLVKAFSSGAFGKQVAEIECILLTTGANGTIDEMAFFEQVKRAAIKFDIDHSRIVRANVALVGGAAATESRTAVTHQRCFNCGRVGDHNRSDCPETTPCCWNCHKPGHNRLNCPILVNQGNGSAPQRERGWGR